MPGTGTNTPAMPDPMVQPGGDSIMPDSGMPSEGMDTMMGNASDMGAMPPMDGQTNDPYAADFDAGVEANEETDPKKYIQQLTGKLSQSLRKYNEGLPQPDADLAKYVAGMTIKQCIEGLPQEDVQEILDKVKTDEELQQPESGMEQPNAPMNSQTQDMESQEDAQMQTPLPPMNEENSVRQSVANRYNEFTKEDNGTSEKVRNRSSYHKSPWVGKTFKA